MKNRKHILLLTALLIFSGCGGIEDAEESTVTVNEKGIVTQLLIEDFLSEQYDEEELKTSVQEWVAEYNQKAGAGAVTLKNSEVEEGIAKVMLQYQSDEDYRGFNQVDFFSGTVEEALEEGYTFAGTFTDRKGNIVIEGTVPEQCRGKKVIIIREPLQVLVPGKILYVSKNMEAAEADTARMLVDSTADYAEMQVTTEAYGYVIYEED